MGCSNQDPSDPSSMLAPVWARLQQQRRPVQAVLWPVLGCAAAEARIGILAHMAVSHTLISSTQFKYLTSNAPTLSPTTLAGWRWSGRGGCSSCNWSEAVAGAGRRRGWIRNRHSGTHGGACTVGGRAAARVGAGGGVPSSQ